MTTTAHGESAPRTWSMPDPPGPEVTAVRTALDQRYERGSDGYWRGPGQTVLRTWRQLLIIGPLTDATQTAAPDRSCPVHGERNYCDGTCEES